MSQAGLLSPEKLEPPVARVPRSNAILHTGQGIGADAVLRTLAASAAVIVILMLASLIAVLTVAAVPSIRAFGLKFLVSSEWRPNELQTPKLDANGDPVIEDGETVMTTIPPAFGALPVIYGTAVSSVIALIVAVPLSFGAALFLIRIAPKVLSGPVSFLIEFLAAIPSIAYGIWGLFVLAPLLQTHLEPGVQWIYQRLPAGSWTGAGYTIVLIVACLLFMNVVSRKSIGGARAAAFVALVGPLALLVVGLLCVHPATHLITAVLPRLEPGLQGIFGTPPNLAWVFSEKVTVSGQTFHRQLPLTGRDMFCGGIVLAVMILPIITAISRDVLRSVPRTQIEGTVALGATWWQSSWEMLRYSRSGLFGAVMLGMARAAGETMAITMVIGNNNQIRGSLFAPAQTMSSLLANEFAEANTAIHRAALTEVALVLLVMSLIFNIVARYLVVGKATRAAA